MSLDENLRDEIAIQAMAGIIAKVPMHRLVAGLEADSTKAAQKHRARVAASAYRYADAMLEARKAPGAAS